MKKYLIYYMIVLGVCCVSCEKDLEIDKITLKKTLQS